MASHNLTRTQKNAVLGLIRDIGLDPAEFVWDEDYSDVVQVSLRQQRPTVEILSHGPTNYWFKFGIDERGSLWSVFYPGSEGPKDRAHSGSWEQVRNRARQSLEQVREEYEAPDMWAALEEQHGLLTGGAVENSAFNQDERGQIEAHLTEAKAYARANLELEPSQLDRIEATLDYLIEVAPRSRRIEWRNIVVGSLVAQVIEAAIPVAAIQNLWAFLFHGLAGLFGGGSGTPELPGGEPPEFIA